MLKTINGSATSGLVNLDPNPTQGGYRKYRIRTVATDEAFKYSAWNECSTVVKTVSASAPFEQQPVQTMPPYRVVHIWRRIK